MGLRSWLTGPEPEMVPAGGNIEVRDRDAYPLSIGDWVEQLTYQGVTYPTVDTGQALRQQEAAKTYLGYGEAFYKRNPVVFACMATRAELFAEARFQFRQFKDGRPGDLFGAQALQPLETPWPNGQTADLLKWMLLDVDLNGNAFVRKTPDGGLERLRPDWVVVVEGEYGQGGRRGRTVVGYLYYPGGRASGEDPVVMLPQEIAHWAPHPDPLNDAIGMSWLTPVVREIMGDKATTERKLTFFEQGGPPFAVILGSEMDPDNFQRWAAMFQEKYGGSSAFKTMILTAGAQLVPVGAQQLNIQEAQGVGEARICAAARIDPRLVGLSLGVQSAPFATYEEARKRFTSFTMRPLWRSCAQSLDNIIETPPGAQLWYDDRDVPALQESQKEKTDIQSAKATTITGLIKDGFTPESAIDAVLSDDLSRLKHSGLVSVQLYPPGEGPQSDKPTVSAESNGAGNGATMPAMAQNGQGE